MAWDCQGLDWRRPMLAVAWAGHSMVFSSPVLHIAWAAQDLDWPWLGFTRHWLGVVCCVKGLTWPGHCLCW